MSGRGPAGFSNSKLYEMVYYTENLAEFAKFTQFPKYDFMLRHLQ